MAGTRARKPTEKMLQLMEERARGSEGEDGSEGSEREMKVVKKARVDGGSKKTAAREKAKGSGKEKLKAKAKAKAKEQPTKQSGRAPAKGKKVRSRVESNDGGVIDLVGNSDDDDENGEGGEEDSGEEDDDEDDAAGVRCHVQSRASDSSPNRYSPGVSSPMMSLSHFLASESRRKTRHAT